MSLTFTDPNFKLMVINELMYNQEVLTPKFRLRDFLAEQGLEEPEYGDPCPQARAWFEGLEVPEELAASITEFSQDGGDQLHLEIFPVWDGEDDYFTLASAADAALFPNLAKVTLLYSEDAGLLEQFQARGIEAGWV